MVDAMRVVPAEEAARIKDEAKDPAFAALMRGSMIEMATTNGRLFNGLGAKLRHRGQKLQRYPSNGHTYLWVDNDGDEPQAETAVPATKAAAK